MSRVLCVQLDRLRHPGSASLGCRECLAGHAGSEILAQATLSLAGAAQLKVEPAQLSFTPIHSGETTSTTLMVSSTGSLRANTLSFSLRGADATQFAIPQGGCTSLSSLPAGASCTFSVSYRPQAAGSHSGELVLGFAGGEPVVVPLAAEARPVALGASVAADPGEVSVGQTAALSFSLSNPSSMTTTASLTLSVRDAQGQQVSSWPILATLADPTPTTRAARASRPRPAWRGRKAHAGIEPAQPTAGHQQLRGHASPGDGAGGSGRGHPT